MVAVMPGTFLSACFRQEFEENPSEPPCAACGFSAESSNPHAAHGGSEVLHSLRYFLDGQFISGRIPWLTPGVITPSRQRLCKKSSGDRAFAARHGCWERIISLRASSSLR